MSIIIGYLAIEGYNDAQPKSSVDLFYKLDAIEIEDYDKYSIDLTKDDYKEIKEFVSKSVSSISQFTILEYENEM